MTTPLNSPLRSGKDASLVLHVWQGRIVCGDGTDTGTSPLLSVWKSGPLTGPMPGLRWNATGTKLEFSHDGVTWAAMGTGGESGGDMLKSTYDTNNDGVIDAAAIPSLNTAKISNFTEATQDVVGAMVADSTSIDASYDDATGVQTLDLKPTSVVAGSYTNANVTIGADGRITSASHGSAGGSGDMLKSTYDTNNNGKVDQAQNADAVGNVTISGVPAPGQVLTATSPTAAAWAAPAGGAGGADISTVWLFN